MNTISSYTAGSIKTKTEDRFTGISAQTSDIYYWDAWDSE